MIKNYKKIFFLLIMCLCLGVCEVYAKEVVPLGRAVGIQLYTDGLLVIGTTAVEGKNIAADAGIKVNDRILSVNDVKVKTSEELSKIINENSQGVTIAIDRDNRIFTVNAVPVCGSDKVFRLGIWVRDSCAGIGTLTYFDADNNSFAALGHGINDMDTDALMTVKEGVITQCNILSVTKSSKGVPGEINADFTDKRLGDIIRNTSAGIFGAYTDSLNSDERESMPVASTEEIELGDAYILSDILGSKREKYSVNIKKITNNSDKSLVLDITDERLIGATGGIVQGMSGSPIIQNQKLIGAVTHVFVNNPLKGYGIAAEKMVQANEQ